MKGNKVKYRNMTEQADPQLEKNQQPNDTTPPKSIHFSPDMLRAFNSIDAFATGRMGNQELIKNKQEIVTEVTKKKLLENVLTEYPLVYIGSGTDIEYPLCLGGRVIVMVDPIFESPKALADIKTKIENITGEKIAQQSLEKLGFTFDFGSGKKPVIVHFSPKYYGSPESLERRRRVWQNMPSATGKKVEGNIPPLPRFEPPEKIGLLLGFQSWVDEDLQALDNLVTGGYILTNDLFTRIAISTVEVDIGDNGRMFRKE